MGFFLLGVPLGLLGAYSFCKDIDKTITEESVPNAKRTSYEQKEQINQYFVQILKSCKADCKITRNKVYDVKKGRYGGMEIFLAKRGYDKIAINYCKDKFDSIWEKEHTKHINSAKKDIKDFENNLRKNNNHDITLTINKYKSKSQREVEIDVNQLINYFNTHNNNVKVNIIMGGTKPHHNHTEIWTIKEPNNCNALDYYFNVCDVLGIE